MVIVTCIERARSVDSLKILLEGYVYTQFTSDVRLEHSGNASVDQALLDAAADGLQGAFHHLLASLKRERNRLSPVSFLPREVLARVFSFGDQETPLRVSAVCHTWRTAAISEPYLWAEVDMSRGRMHDSLLQLYLQRNGVVPLIIHLPLLSPQHVHTFINQLTPILQRAEAISNLSVSSQISFPIPNLRSLHLVAAVDNAPSLLRLYPNLLHLSLDLRSSSIPPFFCQRLRTLHLVRVNANRSEVLRLVASLHFLEELSLESVVESSLFASLELDPEPISGDRALTYIYLIDLRFLWYSILPLIDSPTTNLLIHSLSSDDKYFSQHFERNLSVSAVYIDYANHSVTFDHYSCLTKLYISSIDTHVPFVDLPMFVPVYSMRSLAWTDGHPLPATTFGAFSSLNRLSFTFSPSPVGDFPKRLDSIINADLVTLCPHIVYLALHLCKSSISSIVYKDGVEDALVSFLESWTELHQRRFPVLWIQDDIKPSRWVDLMPAFEAFVDSFELGEIDVLENLPTFPEKMRFLPEPPDTIKRPSAKPFMLYRRTRLPD